MTTHDTRNITAVASKRRKGTGPARSWGILFTHPEVRFVPFPKRGSSTLGRSSDASEQIVGSLVSREHVQISKEGPLYILRDLGSTNGTHHNGKRIDLTPVTSQDVVRVGNWVGVVTELEDAWHEEPFLKDEQAWLGPALRRAWAGLERFVDSDVPVIVSGPTGVGKEVFAKRLHTESRRQGAFVAVNCAAIPDSLAEAELFGHTAGAFSGAGRARMGHIRRADEGTLLLDEIGDLSPATQTKLLRVLEERCVQPLGDDRALRVDVRVIAAGQEDLGEAAEAGRFRGDLYARLAGVRVELPALRERREDVAPLFRWGLEQYLGGDVPELEPELVESLLLHNWPYNVRELLQLTRYLAVQYEHEPELLLEHVESHLDITSSGSRENLEAQPPVPSSRTRVSKETETERLLRALAQHHGNISRAATTLGISRQRAYRMLEARPDLKQARKPSARRAKEK